MWTEFRPSGILDEVVRWHFSFGVYMLVFSFPDEPRPAAPDAEVQSIHHLANLDRIVGALALVRIALQMPSAAFANTRSKTATRFEPHKCWLAADLLLSFAQRLITQDNSYSPAFCEILHPYKPCILFVTLCSFSLRANGIYLQSLRSRLPDLVDFLQDPGHFQQPCVCIRLLHGTLLFMREPRIRMYHTEYIPCNLY